MQTGFLCLVPVCRSFVVGCLVAGFLGFLADFVARCSVDRSAVRFVLVRLDFAGRLGCFVYCCFAAAFDFNNVNYAANLTNELLNMPLYLFAGFAFSFLYDKFGLAASFTSHALNNLVSIISTIILIKNA